MIQAFNTPTIPPQQPEALEPEFAATYSPEDNKLRLYITNGVRLSAELYAEVKKTGYIWAGAQKIFVAPMWTPNRAALATRLAGDIGDEGISLEERAVMRSERFGDYRDARAEDAERAKAYVERLGGVDGIIASQDHRRANKAKEKLVDGMKKVADLWSTADYWQRRAKGSLRHSEMKERPDVRVRRIKGLKTDLRRCLKKVEEAETWIKRWNGIAKTLENYIKLAGYDYTSESYSGLKDGKITLDQAQEHAIANHTRNIEHEQPWITHIGFRIGYEEAMLEASGGAPVIPVNPLVSKLEVGGAIYSQYNNTDWCEVIKIHKKSVDYMWGHSQSGTKSKGRRDIEGVKAVMTKAQYQAYLETGREPSYEETHRLEIPITVAEKEAATVPAPDFHAKAQEVKDRLKAGITVVTAHGLFPTPEDVAKNMVDLLDPRQGEWILEPSAGTGRLIQAVLDRFSVKDITLQAVEINYNLASMLRAKFPVQVFEQDFLDFPTDGTFRYDKIIMNPPFAGGADIKHIQHAMKFLKPGGTLVAICAAGPRQKDTLYPIVQQHGGTWEELPEGTFKESGTNIRSIMLSVTT